MDIRSCNTKMMLSYSLQSVSHVQGNQDHVTRIKCQDDRIGKSFVRKVTFVLAFTESVIYFDSECADVL